jgi:hypothetical protein
MYRESLWAKSKELSAKSKRFRAAASPPPSDGRFERREQDRDEMDKHQAQNRLYVFLRGCVSGRVMGLSSGLRPRTCRVRCLFR